VHARSRGHYGRNGHVQYLRLSGQKEAEEDAEEEEEQMQEVA
jgi:hypothetical protein